MTPTSSIYLVKAAVFDLLSARTVLQTTPVQVHWGSPNRDHDIHENVYVTDTVADEEFDQLSNRRPASLEKLITVQVVVEVYREGVDARATEQRMWELVDEVHTAIALDPTLLGTAWNAKVAHTEQKNPAYEGVRIASAVITVEAHVSTRAT